MKKTVVLILALTMALTLAACGGKTPSSAAPASSAPASSAASTEPAPAISEEPAAAGVFETDGRQYITADQLKADIENGEDVFLLDIQPEENYNENHLTGAVATYAFPVETDEEKAAVDAVLGDAEGSALVIVCPGGGKGANNTWDYLAESGYDMSTVFILENGQNGWPHAELLDA